MVETVDSLVLQRVRYNDSSDVVRVYTRQHGNMSLLLRCSRSSRRVAASRLFQPLSVLQLEISVSAHGSLSYVREARSLMAYESLAFDCRKSSIVMFLAEVLCHSLREEVGNEALFLFLQYSFRIFDAVPTPQCANFHLAFLINLLRFLGVMPDVGSYVPNTFFDLQNSCFSFERPRGNSLPPEEAKAMVALMRMTYRNMWMFRLNRTQRNRCLDVLMDYYQLHVPGFGSLKSTDVLRQLFD
ncbi:MAG: DNA repair protein RecO [Bacteroidales bacterium]|nr:DNA repair protein RecO [Bacteroidales bacterium]